MTESRVFLVNGISGTVFAKVSDFVVSKVVAMGPCKEARESTKEKVRVSILVRAYGREISENAA